MKEHHVSVSDFKAHCLEYLDKTRTHQAEYIVSKRGKPIAKLIPLPEDTQEFSFGQLKGSVTIKSDIMKPIDVDWENAD